VDRRWIVVFHEGTPLDVQVQVVENTLSSVLHILSLINALAIELPAVGAEAALAVLQVDPLVKRVDGDPPIDMYDDGQGSDGSVTPAPAPVQEFYSWGHYMIGAVDVQTQNPNLEGDEVKVALLDTGVDPDHPDLKTRIIGGYNSLAKREPAKWKDDNGHGTHVAGTVAALLNNVGVIGVAPRVKIYVLKTLDQYGQGKTSDFINALQRVPSDIRIIAASCGTDIVWPSFGDAISLLSQAGKLMVFSAGNNCIPNCPTPPPTDIKFPARYQGVIAVGATNQSDLVAGFSRSGPAMATHGVVAPGVNIFSDNMGGGYAWLTGTSAATPHVTGAVALALQLEPNLTYGGLWDLLQQTAKGLLGYLPGQQGAGRIDVCRMVQWLNSPQQCP
jgi:subtilisin